MNRKVSKTAVSVAAFISAPYWDSAQTIRVQRWVSTFRTRTYFQSETFDSDSASLLNASNPINVGTTTTEGGVLSQISGEVNFG